MSSIPLAKNHHSSSARAPESSRDLVDELAVAVARTARGSPGRRRRRSICSWKRSSVPVGRAGPCRRAPIAVQPLALRGRVAPRRGRRSTIRARARLAAGEEELALGAEQPEQVGLGDARPRRRSPRSRCRCSRRRRSGAARCATICSRRSAAGQRLRVGRRHMRSLRFSGRLSSSRQTSTETSSTGSGIGGSGLAALTVTRLGAEAAPRAGRRSPRTGARASCRSAAGRRARSPGRPRRSRRCPRRGR